MDKPGVGVLPNVKARSPPSHTARLAACRSSTSIVECSRRVSRGRLANKVVCGGRRFVILAFPSRSSLAAA